MIVLENICKSYEQTRACADVNLHIKEGEFFTFLGPSGCGKTTTLRIIAGFIDADSGRLTIDNDDMQDIPPEKRGVGMVFQNYALFPFMSVFDNIAYSLKVKKLSKIQIEEKVNMYLEMVKLEGYGQRAISELSGGEQQRVALARSLAMEPRVLLLDEPLSNLDAKLRLSMRHEIKSIVKTLGITTIFVTHDQGEALSMSDRIAVFNKGRCIQVGTPEEIYTQPYNAFVARFIGDINLWTFEKKDGRAYLGENFSLPLRQDADAQYIAFRPQDVELSKEADMENQWIEGRIVNQQLTGYITEYDIRAASLSVKAACINTHKQTNFFSTGEKVFIRIKPEAIQLLNE